MIEESSSARKCVFCPATEELTHDHIPPRCLFPPPRSNDIITVTSCLKCNKGSEKDDTYFRDTLLFWDVTQDHPEAKKVADTVIRSFGRPQQVGYSRSFIDSVMEMDTFTPGGLYVGKRFGKPLDHLRLNRTAKKIVKGLFCHEFGERLPDNCDAMAFGLRNEQEQQKQLWLQETCSKLVGEPQTTIGNGVFHYWFHQEDDAPEKSLWLLLFYEKVPFMGLTGPKDDILAASRAYTITPSTRQLPCHGVE